MTRKRWSMAALALLAAWMLLASACDVNDDDDDDSSFDDNATGPKAPAPTEDAFQRPGPTDDGRVILPNGRALSPVGISTGVQRFPVSLALGADGDTVYCATVRTPMLYAIDARTMTVIAAVELPNHFGGMALSPDGARLWVGGGASEVVMEFDIAGVVPVLARTIPAIGFPTDLALTADGSKLYVALGQGKTVAVFDTLSGEQTSELVTKTYPFAVALDEASDRAVVTCWGTDNALVFRLSDGERLASADVGKNPEGVAIVGGLAFVAASDDDAVTVLDVETGDVAGRVDLRGGDRRGVGAFPTAVAAAPGGDRVYVATSGFNSVTVLDAASFDVLGAIPAQWYPTDIVATADTLFVASGKGTSVGPGWSGDGSPDYAPHEDRLFGSVEAVAAPDAGTLAEYTAMVADNNSRAALFYDDLDFESPIPVEDGVASERIKHVVFILKENKTFDQLLGDFPGAEGSPALLMFGRNVTPNLYALAGQYALCDNYYVDSEQSVQGHMWSTASTINDYIEKTWLSQGWTNLPGIEPAAIPSTKFFFHHLINHGVDFRIYGEVTGTLSDMDLFAPYMDFDYGFYNGEISDRLKAKEVIREWEAGLFPSYIYILLPNDHTAGTTPGSPTPEYYLADNDAGVGLLIDWLTKSPYWKNTVVFMTEDDPQTGADHIDPHRTPMTVMSPYVKRGYVSHVQYSIASLFRTMELILGVPPMNDYDRFASPMYDLFTTAPILDHYTAIPSNIPYAENPDDAPMADVSSKQIWDVPDQAERLGEILWAYTKPGTAFPAHLSIDPATENEEEEAEEKADARNYRELIEAYTRYAVERKLLGEHHLMKKGVWVDTTDGAWRVFTRPPRPERQTQ